MALRKIVITNWYCDMCQYRTEKEQKSTRCPACGHDNFANNDMETEFNQTYMKHYWDLLA